MIFLRPFLLFCCTLICFESAFAKKIQITSFNIKWFGQYLEDGKDYRIPWIKEYLQPYIKEQDVILFQEIVNIDSFLKDIIKDQMTCRSHDREDKRSHHIIICYRKDWSFVSYRNDKDFVIEEIILDTPGLRPALHGIIRDHKGKDLFHLIGVHLKAYSEEWKVREDQVRKIIEFLDKDPKSSDIPRIISGDFNTHKKEDTKRDQDDVVFLSEILKEARLEHVSLENGATYITSRGRGNLDHYWLSGFTKPRKLSVPKICRNGGGKGSRFNNIYYYNHFVSDHCPVTLELNIKN